MVGALAVGLAMMVAVEVINSAALARFDAGVRRIAGGVDLQLLPRMGHLHDADLAIVRGIPGVRHAAPVLRGRVVVATERDTAVDWLALDLLADGWLRPDSGVQALLPGDLTPLFDHGAVLLGSDLADELGVAKGAELYSATAGRPVTLRVVGLLPPGWADRAMVLDIATAQWTFGRLDELDRIDLALDPNVPRDALVRAVAASLGERVLTADPQLDTRRLAAMTRAYRINLRVLSGVGLLTAGFLIWSLLELGLRRRHAELRLLRTMGMDDRQLFWSLAGTALLVALPGLVVGAAAGYGVGALGLAWTGGDLGAGYFQVDSAWPVIPVGAIIGPLGVGLLGLLLACAQPMAHAMRAAAGQGAVPGDAARGGSRSGLLLAGSLAALAAAGLLARLPSVAGIPVAGYASITLVIGAGITALPPAISAVLYGYRLSPGSGAAGLVLARLRAAPGRAALAAAAALVSFALMVAMSGMVWSFRGSVEVWLDRVLRADLFVSAGSPQGSDVITAQEAQRIRRLPDVAAVETLRDLALTWPGSAADEPEVLLGGRDLRMAGVRKMFGLDGQADTAGGCVVSESFASRFPIGVGDSLALPGQGTAEQCRVLAVWRDYGYQWGRVVLDTQQFQRLTGLTDFSGLAIFGVPQASVEGVREAVQRLFGNRPGIAISDQVALRAAAIESFDRTFAVTYLLVVIAVLVGVLAVINTQLLQLEQRRAELSVLLHLGWRRARLRGLLALEAAGMASLGVAGGTLGGILCTLILNRVVNVQSFHWTIDTYIPWGVVAAAGGLLIGSAALSSALLVTGRATATTSLALGAQ